MTSMSKILIACTVLALPLATAARADDASYCKALIAKYRAEVPQTADPNATVPVAMTKCQGGDYSGIPVLEQALKDNKVTLPPRN
jgi:hypothetical protein